ncbi:hypothetical protein L596_009419 [Steinernema carpocapsae]|uniref:RING-type domain-containing protein n=1 Tax=Steinernema carpocapsae TaxID=34508 RepID=A0A4U5PFA7_STECR|nr:hypothetical protein L596_009419 [Steinernema carpocapsae]
MPLSCSICQLAYDGSSEAAIGALPCGHVFHVDCVQKWFNQLNDTCPDCRSKSDPKNLLRLFFDAPQNTGETFEAQAFRLEQELAETRKELNECKANLVCKNNTITFLEKQNENLTQTSKAARLAMVKNIEMEKQLKFLEEIRANRDHLATQLALLKDRKRPADIEDRDIS